MVTSESVEILVIWNIYLQFTIGREESSTEGFELSILSAESKLHSEPVELI